MSILNTIKKLAGLKTDKEKSDAEQAKNALEVFRKAKEAIKDATLPDVKKYIQETEKRHKKFVEGGQFTAAAKATWLMQVARAEEGLVGVGITKYIPVDLLQDLCDKHPSRAIKICNLEDYERELPDEVLEAKKKVDGIFDLFMVIYTDHTKKQKAANVQKTRDPILVGLFKGEVKSGPEPKEGERDHRAGVGVISDRLYVIASWEDEYCDLTLDKFIREASENGLKWNPNVSVYIDPEIRVEDMEKAVSLVKKVLHTKKEEPKNEEPKNEEPKKETPATEAAETSSPAQTDGQ